MAASAVLTVAGVVTVSAIGVIALYRRLRVEFDGPVALLAVILSVAATPLFAAITGQSDVLAALAFLASALLMGLLVAPAGTRTRVVAAVSIVVLPLLTGLMTASVDEGALAALYSPAEGLFSLTPVVYVGFLGSMAYSRVQPFAGATAVAAVLLWAMLGAPLLPAVAVLAPGLAFVIAWARTRPLVAVAPLVALGLFWNYWLMVQYTVGTIPKDAPLEFSAMVRQQADVHTRSPYFYPFAFPANVYFAWREDVPVDRYGVLSAIPNAATFDLAMDRGADRFLLEGWDAPGQDAAGPVWWMGARRASLVFPIDPPSAPLSIAITARSRLLGAPVNAELGVEINGHEVGRFVAAATRPTTAEFTLPTASVGRLLRAGYNRLTIVSHGIHRADPPNAQPRDPRAGRKGNRAWPVAIYRIRVIPAS